MKRKAISNDEAIGRLMMVLARHVGEENAIDMGELYEEVFEAEYSNKINDTRRLRRLIDHLRRQKHVPIGSVSRSDGGGYYLIRAGSELNDHCDRLHRRALGILSMEAGFRKVSMPQLLGQMSMRLE